MLPTTRVQVLAVIAMTGALHAGASFAQTYPTKPLRLLVPTAPGGGLDITARLIAPLLTESLGKSVVVDNRPGASGAIALETTARAAPDGHTLVIFSVSQVIHAELNKTSYDMFRDFAPITQLTAAPYVFTVYPGLPVKSVSELITYAKAHPGELKLRLIGNCKRCSSSRPSSSLSPPASSSCTCRIKASARRFPI